MKSALDNRRWRAGLLVLALCLAASGAISRSAEAAGLGLARSEVDPQLAPIARGFDLWLANGLAHAGLAPRLYEESGLAAIAVAAGTGEAHVVVPRLRERSGRIEVQLLLYAPGTSALIAATRGEAPLGDLGPACHDALIALVQSLGMTLPSSTPPLLSELTSASRASELRERGQLFHAWRSVQGKLSPTAMSLRESIVEEARKPGANRSERARVLTATGDVVSAWSLIGSDATQELRKARVDPALLVAAAEVQIANTNPRDAVRYLERALEQDPDSADALLALGRARLLQNQRDAARAALRSASELSPDDSRPFELLIELDAGQPHRVAAHWLDAGTRAAHRLEPDHARRQLQRAGELEPGLVPRSAVALGDLEARIGNPAQALSAYRRAIGAGVVEPAVFVGAGRAQRALSNDRAAEASLRRAIEVAPGHGPALAELGTLLADSGRGGEAVTVLRSAHEIDQGDPDVRLRLARVLRTQGDDAGAVQVLSAQKKPLGVLGLRELALGMANSGDLVGAEQRLQAAVAEEPHDQALRESLAKVLEQLGSRDEAEEQRATASLLAGTQARQTGGDTAITTARVTLDELIVSFAMQVTRASAQRMGHLGGREPGDWRTRLFGLVRPRSPDLTAIDAALGAAIVARFAPTGALGEHDGTLDPYIDRLYDFDSKDSLSADVIAAVNQVLGIDGVFVTRVIAHPKPLDPEAAESAAAVCEAGTFMLETRLLQGRDPEFVSILSNTDCIEGGFETYGTWNYVAFAVYAFAGLLLGYPFLRGWGTVVVRIRLPDKTKGFFSIHLTTGTDKVGRETVDKRTGREQIRSNRRFDFLRRFERHMAGRQTIFRWIPARKGDYTVTVGGPLHDARGEEIIGHFLEEQNIRVRRHRTTEIDFDFRPKECAVEVKVTSDGAPAAGARVAVEGDISSLRYARDGAAFLYLGMGEYTILIGAQGCAGAFRILIESLDAAIPLKVDLAACELVFRDCPDAVEPFLQGDLATAADALERAGDSHAAARMRADLLERRGQAGAAARELEAAGDLEQAAELRASDQDLAGSAALFEQAGDHAKAGDTFRAAGDFAEAGRCYELVYDYENAIDCWREVGDHERELALLEKTGEFMDAGLLARQMGDLDRAITNLQQVEQRDSAYREACRAIAEIVGERGDHELAVLKFEEAFKETGAENAPIEALETYAEMLERAGQREQALSALESIRRRDAHRTDVATRIEVLRQEITASDSNAQATQAMPGAPRTLEHESRYEILEEIGRGGMGVVFKARDKRLGRIVALKKMPENLRDHPTAVALFEREARAAAALNHQNIVTLFDAGDEGGSYFITMELLEGRPLNAILDRHGRITVRDVARIGVQIAAGLQYAHDRRIVHRDIKTANLFFTNEQVVKIMDFGIAKSLEEVRRSTTIVGGTPYYMAPEQGSGQPVDERADLYAFGVTLFQLATGALPFSEGDVTYLHCHEPPPDPRELDLDFPASMADLILWMMAKSPDERPASAAIVSEKLSEIQTELG